MQTLIQPPTEEAFVQNPYRFYQQARKSGDLVFWQDYNRICATSHQAVNHFLRDKNWGRERPAGFAKPVPDHIKPFMTIENHSMLELDGPPHTRLRAQVLRAFTSRRIAALAPEIETLCHHLIDAFDRPDVDLLPAYCTPIPVTIIARLIGAPETDANLLLDWSHKMVAMYQATRTRADEDAAAQAATGFSAYLSDLQADRALRPRDDLLSALVAATGTKLSPEELTSTCILLLNAGHEATVHAIANGLKTMLEHGCPQPTAPTLEETLRFDPPLHLFERHAKTDCHAFGHAFKKGDTVACLLASANRDETVFGNSESFLPARAKNPLVSFGAGVHFCLGAPLARLEMQIAIQTLFDRIPNLRLSQPPRYANSYHFHGLTALNCTY